MNLPAPSSPGAGLPPAASRPRRLLIALTGATGVAYGVRLLEWLHARPGIETHLLVSSAAWLTIEQELTIGKAQIESLASIVHNVKDIGASIASGSYPHDGMVIAPCSMRTLAAVATGLSDNLITRAADVTLKERRRLILMVREAPFNLAHLRNMTAVTEMGGIIFPPLPALYLRPQSVEQIIDHTCARVLDLLGIDNDLAPHWAGRRGV